MIKSWFLAICTIVGISSVSAQGLEPFSQGFAKDEVNVEKEELYLSRERKLMGCKDFCFFPTHFPSDIVQQLDQVLDEAFISQQLVGAIVGVWVPGEGAWVRAKGLGNVAKDKPIEFLDQVRIGSITKTFTTTVLLQLVDEGLICLDETIERFNTGVQNANLITIRELANHTSGLYDYTDDPEFEEIFLTDPLRIWAPQELIQIAIDHGPIALPGTQVKYNNTNFIIQEVIINQLTGQSLHQAIKERITKPLRLKYTTLPTDAQFTRKFAHGYIVESPTNLIDFTFTSPTSAGGAGGMLSNIKDLKKWVKILVQGQLLSKETQQERLTFVTPSPIPGPFQGPFLKYGLGIEKLGPFLGHEGDIPGYNCSMNYLAKHDATFIVILNRDSSFSDERSFPSDEATTLFKKLSKVVFPNEVPW